MTFQKIDYSHPIIYELVCNEVKITYCYVSHTTDYTRHKQMHKVQCNNKNNKSYNLNVYRFIGETGG